MTQQGEKTFYDVLGVNRDATDREIKKAYRRRVRQLHPDTNPEVSDDAIMELNRAYKALSTPGLRSAYDSLLALGDPVTSSAPTRPKKETIRRKLQRLRYGLTDYVSFVYISIIDFFRAVFVEIGYFFGSIFAEIGYFASSIATNISIFPIISTIVIIALIAGAALVGFVVVH